jgi:AcrR family transcriptional regulator
MHREPLTRDRIIEAALHIVDGQGLSRLTMRRLGDALEVEAMAIYHHLPRGKEQLLDGLISYVAARPADPGALDAAGGAAAWRDVLHDWASGYRARLLEHVGVLPLLLTRRDPLVLTETTASLREILRRAGFPERAGAAGAHTLLGYVIGHAALEARGRAGLESAADDDDDGDGDAPDWDRRFTAGLEIVLTGLTAGLSPG